MHSKQYHAGIVGEIEGQLLLAFSNIRDSQEATFSFLAFSILSKSQPKPNF